MAAITADTANRAARDLYERALSALQRNNLEYAIEMFLQCLNLEQNFVQARTFLRAAELKQPAGSFMKRMMVTAKAAGHLTKAKMSIAKNPAEAMNTAEQVLTADPKNTQALMILAEAAEAGNFPETAVLVLEYYIKLNARDIKTMHWLGRLYCSQNSYDLARDLYDHILQIAPSDFAAQKALKDVTARGAMHSGGWERAESYRDIIKDKEEAVSLEQQSRVVRAEDMIDNLIKENLERLTNDPENPAIRRELGKLYAQKGDIDSALGYLEKLFSTEGGSDPNLEREIGELKGKRITAHIATKQKQLASNPANAAALENEIAALEKEREKLRLVEAERMVERYPNELEYRFTLGSLYMQLGEIQNATEQFQRSVGQPQRRVASLNYLGQCFQQMGLQDLAIEQYAKAIEEQQTMDNLKKELIYNLGSAYEQMGQMDKAIAEYKKIAAVDYGFRDVRQKIAIKPAPPQNGSAA